MMRIYAINASPRKKWNTATLLQYALDGAKAAGGDSVQTELLHLYDYQYTGCKSCFACKLKGGKSYGTCALRDELSPVLERLSQADAIILGSPVYFGDVSGMLRCFEERLLFPYLTYTEGHASIAPRKIRTGFIYTMNVSAELMDTLGYRSHLSVMEGYVGHVFGSAPVVVHANNTVQFSDYSRYVCTMFSAEEKARYREEHFPDDCRSARELGAALVGK